MSLFADTTLRRQKSEDNLGAAESELEKQTTRNGDLQRKVRDQSPVMVQSLDLIKHFQVEELQVQASLAAKLKDQVDEYVLWLR